MSVQEGQDPGARRTRQSDVLLHVEQETPSSFRIESDQLEQIGSKLRGPRRFSIFNSVVLPALVTLLTTILTGTFQYVSWINTVRLQAASDVADRAAKTFDQVASLIGQRRYATFVFIPSVRDLEQSQTTATMPDEKRDLTPSANSAVYVPTSTATVAPAVTQPLANANFGLDKERYITHITPY